MKNILEELFFGSLDPNAHTPEFNLTSSECCNTLERDERILLEQIDDKLENTFREYSGTYSTLTARSTVGGFIKGFHLGMKIAFECAADDEF